MKMQSVLEAIGKTPLVKLQKINPNPLVEILVKVEFLNPGGSIKDRIVNFIINDAENQGLLKPGGTIIENTSGNTGAAAAMIAAIKGYKCILTMPEKVSTEKKNALKAFGAEIIVCPTEAPPESPDHYVNVAKRLADETPNSFRINQYDNLKNPEAHYLSTGPEIWEQSGGKVDYFIASSSTGGTVSGVSRYLKERNPNMKTIVPDPIGSIFFDYFKTGEIPTGGNCSYQLEGIGEDHLTGAMDFSLVDEVVKVEDRDAFNTSRLLAEEEGLLVGGSCGANVWAAIELAKTLTEPATIVTVLPDGGVKYLSKIYNDNWMKENQFFAEEVHS
ncbi:MAG: cysteine synthase family protein [Chlamydiota bacterium]|nr:cysteine synthase family protein [Chlamydiota bacterium]